MSTIVVVGNGIVGRRITRLVNDHRVIVRDPLRRGCRCLCGGALES